MFFALYRGQKSFSSNRCPSVSIRGPLKFSSKNPGNSSGPKSASILSIDGEDGSQVLPGKLHHFLVGRALFLMTSRTSYSTAMCASSQSEALVHQPQYGLMNRRIFTAIKRFSKYFVQFVVRKKQLISKLLPVPFGATLSCSTATAREMIAAILLSMIHVTELLRPTNSANFLTDFVNYNRSLPT